MEKKESFDGKRAKNQGKSKKKSNSKQTEEIENTVVMVSWKTGLPS
ncbi:MAG: hypothetical protein GY866_07885 [Proteobacteria bacterium]|nr:hypothetical protein [Pseudomonadota bacterium]